MANVSSKSGLKATAPMTKKLRRRRNCDDEVRQRRHGSGDGASVTEAQWRRPSWISNMCPRALEAQLPRGKARNRQQNRTRPPTKSRTKRLTENR